MSIDYQVPEQWPTYSNPQTEELGLVSALIIQYQNTKKRLETLWSQAEKQIN